VLSQRFVANAASVDQIGNKEYLFLANGEGVYAAEFKVEGENFKHQMLGKLNFEAAESINHVLVTEKFLILAAGLEGVYILSVEDNSVPEPTPLPQCGPNELTNPSFESNFVNPGAWSAFNESVVPGWSTTFT